MPRGFSRPHPRSDVRQNHDGKFQALRLVHRHEPDAVAAFLEDRRLGRLRAIDRLAQFFDESTEGDAAVSFILARQLGKVQHVRQRLLARRTQHQADVRAGDSQQVRDGIGDGTLVAAPM